MQQYDQFSHKLHTAVLLTILSAQERGQRQKHYSLLIYEKSVELKHQLNVKIECVFHYNNTEVHLSWKIKTGHLDQKCEHSNGIYCSLQRENILSQKNGYKASPVQGRGKQNAL